MRFSLLLLFCGSGVLASGQTIAACGQQLSPLASYKGVPALSNDSDQTTTMNCDPLNSLYFFGSYGEQFQCVEYVRRFYSQALNVDSTSWHGFNAVEYLDYEHETSPTGLSVFLNGGIVPPSPDDIIVFKSPAGSHSSAGHVAVTTETNCDTNCLNGTASGLVHVIEQNWSRLGVAPLKLSVLNGHFTVTRPGSAYTVLGWLRQVTRIPKWSHHTPAGVGPLAGGGSQSTAYDPGTDRLIVFGGFDSLSNPCCIESDDTWILLNASGAGGTPTWHHLTPATLKGSPKARH